MNALFEIGQKVVCVDSKGTVGLVEGKNYVIKGMSICKCKQVSVSVGVPLDRTRQTNYCTKCGDDPMDNFVHYKQTRFVPLDFDRQADEAIHEALKEDLKVKNFQDN